MIKDDKKAIDRESVFGIFLLKFSTPSFISNIKTDLSIETELDAINKYKIKIIDNIMLIISSGSLNTLNVFLINKERIVMWSPDIANKNIIPSLFVISFNSSSKEDIPRINLFKYIPEFIE